MIDTNMSNTGGKKIERKPPIEGNIAKHFLPNIKYLSILFLIQDARELQWCVWACDPKMFHVKLNGLVSKQQHNRTEQEKMGEGETALSVDISSSDAIEAKDFTYRKTQKGNKNAQNTLLNSMLWNIKWWSMVWHAAKMHSIHEK